MARGMLLTEIIAMQRVAGPGVMSVQALVLDGKEDIVGYLMPRMAMGSLEDVFAG